MWISPSWWEGAGLLCMKTKPWTRNQEYRPGVLALPWNYCVTQGGALNFSDYKFPLSAELK